MKKKRSPFQMDPGQFFFGILITIATYYSIQELISELTSK
jgi:hypothetical protein